MIVLNRGQIAADGTPQQVLTRDLLASVFGVHVNIVTDPATGTPVCLPYAVALEGRGAPDNYARVVEEEMMFA
jgi:iron complex transport system ATP-binding protein